eukprot:1189787-Prorocentrum_minimum.AAC.6
MPNVATLVGATAAGMSMGPGCDEEDEKIWRSGLMSVWSPRNQAAFQVDTAPRAPRAELLNPGSRLLGFLNITADGIR